MPMDPGTIFSLPNSFFLEFFQSAPFGIIIATYQDDRVLEVNDAFCNLTGYSRSQILGKTTAELQIWVDIEDLKRVKVSFREHARVVTFYTRIRTASQEIRRASVIAQLRNIDDGDVLIFRLEAPPDIHMPMLGQEGNFWTLINNLPCVIYRCINDADRTVQYVNQGVRLLLGYEPADLIDASRKKFADLIHPEDRALVHNEISLALNEKVHFQVEYRICTSTKAYKRVCDQGIGIYDQNGHAFAYEGILIDASPRKGTETIVERELMMNSIIAGLASVLMQSSISFVDVCELVLSYAKMATSSSEGFVMIAPEPTSFKSDLKLAEMVPSKNISDVESEIFAIIKNEAFRNVSSFSNKNQILKQIDPGYHWRIFETDLQNYIHVPLLRTGAANGHIFLVNSNRDYDDHDIRVLESLGYLLQVAIQQYTVYSELSKSESRYRNLVEDQQDYVVRWEPNGRITFANGSFLKNIARNNVDEKVPSFMDIFSPEAVEDLKVNLGSINVNNPSFWIEHSLEKMGQNTSFIQWSNHGLFNDHGVLREIQSVGRDITQRKMYENEIQHRINQEKFISLISASFVKSSIENFEQTLYNAISLIGQFFNADHSYLLFFNDTRNVGRVSANWYAKGCKQRSPPVFEFSLQETSNILKKIFENEYIAVLDLQSFLNLEPAGFLPSAIDDVKRFIYTPIHSQGKVIGFLGIESTTEDVHWTRTTAYGINLLGEIVSQLHQRVKNEEALRESETNFRVMFETSQDLLAIINDARHIVWVNNAWGAVLDHSIREIDDFFNILLPEDRNKAESNWSDLASKKKENLRDIELRLKEKSGRIIFLIFSATRVEQRGYLKYFITARDITKQKEAEFLVKQSEERYINLFYKMRDGVAIYKPVEEGAEFIITDFNKAAERIERISKEKIIGHPVSQIFNGVRQSGMLETFQRVYKTGIAEDTGPVLYKDDRIQGWRRNYIYKLSTGEIVAVYSDITDEIVAQQGIRDAEDRIRKSEEKYRLITEGSNDVISILSRDFKIEFINESITRLLGYSTDDMIGKSHLAFVHPDDIKRIFDVIGNFRGNNGVEIIFETRIRHKNKDYLWFETKARKILFDKEMRLLLVSRDITSRKLADEQIRDSEARYRIMLENASDMVFLLDEELHIEFINQDQSKVLGYLNTEILGKLIVDLIDPRDLESARDELIYKLITGEGRFEFRLIKKNGQKTWFETKSTSYIDDRKKRKILLLSRDISEQKKLKDELMLLNQELELRVIERTRALQDAQERLIRTEKLAAAGKIAGMISHELRNPLAAISNSIFYLKMKLEKTDEKVGKHLVTIQKEVDRAAGIITELLDFTRIKQPVFIVGDVVLVIKNAVSRVNIPAKIKIIIDCKPGIIQIRLDPALLEQAFMNIIINAVQAMENGGSLTITAKEEAKQAILNFTDTGVGISKENLHRIFEPLFSTKKTGIGLGLPLVKDIIEKHNGIISVKSEENQGTSFQILLPLHADEMPSL